MYSIRMVHGAQRTFTLLSTMTYRNTQFFLLLSKCCSYLDFQVSSEPAALGITHGVVIQFKLLILYYAQVGVEQVYIDYSSPSSSITIYANNTTICLV